MDKVFYRLWYIDFGGVYKYKDFEDENEAIKEAKEMNERIKVWTGKDDTRLEKHSVELINFMEEEE